MKLDEELLPPEEVDRVLVALLGRSDPPEASREVAPLFLQEDGKKVAAGMPRFDQWAAIWAHNEDPPEAACRGDYSDPADFTKGLRVQDEGAS